MASNAPPPPIKYDVFITFRGTDTGRNFISHLRAALERNGIDAFTDSGLEAGQEIWDTLSDKISESQVSNVVFSPNYADSRWCLDELVRIMECKEADGHTVMPVFLQGVEPTHARNQTGAFGVGFRRLIEDARSADKVESWRRALKRAADVSGLDSNQRMEREIVDELLHRVQLVLGQMSLEDSSRPFIGIESVGEVQSILSLPEVRCLGIWGMGGLGKTMLAKKIYERISKNFDAVCFIENIEEFAEKRELNQSRRNLLSQLLGNDDANKCPPIFFNDDIKRKLRRKKVLVILDDMSDASQLQELIGDFSFYCPGSKMIAISRNKQVLKNVRNKVYEVQTLDYHKSLQLLQLHICKQRQPTVQQMDLLRKDIKYTQGLPLVLMILGRNLFDKDITIWEDELAKLGDSPDLQITKILRTNFDGLEDTEKNIFLDIACGMRYWNKDRIESILDACEFYPKRGIDRLVDKALVTISNNTIEVYDLLRQMAHHIAYREGRHTRLWRKKEIVDLLTKDQAERTRHMEFISMDLSEATNIKLRSRGFENMTRVRILRFSQNPFGINENSIFLPEGLANLSDELRYLEWNRYPLPSLPFGFNPENLVELRMENSNLIQLWTDEVEPFLPSLKHVDLSYSKNLTKLPSFRNSLKLETLWLPKPYKYSGSLTIEKAGNTLA